MHTPKISVIVPVYNAEKYLARCIDSILAQTFTDFLLILVDDGSKDISGKICDEYAAMDNRIRVIHKENGGVSSARNVALKESKGVYIAFADADDIVKPEWLKTFIDNIDGCDICVQGLTFINSKGKISERNIGEIKQSEDVALLVEKLQKAGVFGYLFGKLFRGDIIRNNKGHCQTSVDEFFRFSQKCVTGGT